MCFIDKFFSSHSCIWQISQAERSKLKQRKQKTNNLFSDISVKDWYFMTPNTHSYNCSRNTHLLLRSCLNHNQSNIFVTNTLNLTRPWLWHVHSQYRFCVIITVLQHMGHFALLYSYQYTLQNLSSSPIVALQKTEQPEDTVTQLHCQTYSNILWDSLLHAELPGSRTSQTGYRICILRWGLRKEREWNVKLSRCIPAGREPRLSKTSTRYFCLFLSTLANSELCCAWTQAVRANCIIYRLQIGPAVTVSPEGSYKQIQLQPFF